MNKYEKLGTFLVRLGCVALVAWSALRFIIFVITFLASGGFKHGGGWGMLVQVMIPLVLAAILHWLTPHIASYVGKGLGD